MIWMLADCTSYYGVIELLLGVIVGSSIAVLNRNGLTVTYFVQLTPGVIVILADIFATKEAVEYDATVTLRVLNATGCFSRKVGRRLFL